MPEPESVKTLVVIAGPTAVGKTDVTLELAQYLNCPILSADARQCYRELGIATAKPTEEQLDLVPHYFINSHSIFTAITAAQYERYALEILEEVFQKNSFCILTGGSGLYIRAVCEGLDSIPETPPDIKRVLTQQWQEMGLASLLTKLKELDEVYYSKVDKSNPRRVIRALEVALATGKPFSSFLSSFQQGKSQPRPFKIVKIGLDRERKELYERIDQRMDQMIAQGLFNEAQDLIDYEDLVPLQTVGYQEVFDYIKGKYQKQEAIRLLKRNSRRYAKRQLTWFRKDQQYRWFHPDEFQAILRYLENC